MNTLPVEQLNEVLEVTFKKIQTERMRDVPVLNHKLLVKAINLQQWKTNCIGVLITPWFMNLVLLPNNVAPSEDASSDDHFDTWQNIKVGQEINHVFPSGRYTFVAGYEETIGYYQSCSLFSPMFEFEDQESAEITAQAALVALFDSDYEDVASRHPAEDIKKIWNGEAATPINTGSDINNFQEPQITRTEDLPEKSLDEKLHQPISRRDFFRGRILNPDNKGKDSE